MDDATATEIGNRLDAVQDALAEAFGALRVGGLTGTVRAIDKIERICSQVREYVSQLETRLQSERKRAVEVLKSNNFTFDSLDFRGLRAPIRPEEGEKK